jgi:hypothetical protein
LKAGNYIIPINSFVKKSNTQGGSTMTSNQISRKKHTAIITALFISLFLLQSLVIGAQIPANFSGKWQYDKSSSDKEETGNYSFSGSIVMEITQDTAIIKFTETYIRSGMKDYVMNPRSYLLDGKVVANNSGSGPAREFCAWSEDKKILTITSIMTDAVDGIAQDFTTAFTYVLSADLKTLTVEELHKSKLNGEKTIKNVYRKR